MAPSTKSKRVSQKMTYLSILSYYLCATFPPSLQSLTNPWNLNFHIFQLFPKILLRGRSPGALDNPWKFDPVWFSHIWDHKLRSTGLDSPFQSHPKSSLRSLLITTTYSKQQATVILLICLVLLYANKNSWRMNIKMSPKCTYCVSPASESNCSHETLIGVKLNLSDK